MSDTLPAPITAYYAAQTPNDIAQRFTQDGIALDERHTHRGRDAIRQWREEVAKISYSQEILSFRREGNRVTVATRISGAFKGSPVELQNVFDLDGDLIARLEIS
ncbi:MAG: polyketide cyclase [Ahrensia sp.]|nr:polyketide cyclase [Ahrensia sp.]|tara:strand:+ start:26141 stop:26455 length:315 start_codon:yes stop_codon:yes gene_type:complete